MLHITPREQIERAANNFVTAIRTACLVAFFLTPFGWSSLWWIVAAVAIELAMEFHIESLSARIAARRKRDADAEYMRKAREELERQRKMAAEHAPGLT